MYDLIRRTLPMRLRVSPLSEPTLRVKYSRTSLETFLKQSAGYLQILVAEFSRYPSRPGNVLGSYLHADVFLPLPCCRHSSIYCLLRAFRLFLPILPSSTV